ncbi:hypothetical protein [Crateriforma conspicua]|uniref:hypothetical protein n=1 Tax=Crateriforma conspicua TaxID=2527996 RepID=UPI00118B6AD3|nr:hypothetical protein [Crateriforma conspicua]QDV63787.1 hypothetical protein Mal65_29330 [Crateriforma conspicua]
MDKHYVCLQDGGEFVAAAETPAEAVAWFCIAEVVDKAHEYLDGPPANLRPAYWVHNGRMAKAVPVLLADAMACLERSNWPLLNAGLEMNVSADLYRHHCEALVELLELIEEMQ